MLILEINIINILVGKNMIKEVLKNIYDFIIKYIIFKNLSYLRASGSSLVLKI